MNRDGSGMESVDEVLADIRQRAINCANEGAGRPGVAMTENRLVAGLLLSFADRLAAAVARERGRTGTPPQNADGGEPVTKGNGLVHPPEECAVGWNVAKMRKAMLVVYDWILKAGLVHGYVDTPQKRRQLYDMMTKALSAKPRNCDVGTAVKQTERWKTFCSAHYRADMEDWQCGCCPCGDEKSSANCEFEWGQMPYDEKWRQR